MFIMDGKRKLDTDAIVATAMKEEEGRKKQKKGTAPGQQGKTISVLYRLHSCPSIVAQSMQSTNAGNAKKGLTLSEVEAAEGGTVKEGLVTAAQHKRALQRKRKGKNAGRHLHVPSPCPYLNMCERSYMKTWSYLQVKTQTCLLMSRRQRRF